MPKLERFKKDNNKPTTKHILISAGIIFILLAVFVVYKSFAIYTDKKTYDVIKAKIGNFIYNINYDLDGGTLPQGVTNPSTYTINTPDITLNNPTKEGYTFIGWYNKNLINNGKKYYVDWEGTERIDLISYDSNTDIYTINGTQSSNHVYGYDVIDMVEVGKTYTISMKILENSSNGKVWIGSQGNTNGSRYSVRDVVTANVGDTISYTFEVPQGATSCIVGVLNAEDGTGLKVTQMQLEEGSEATKYEPYISDNYSIKHGTSGAKNIKALWLKKESTFLAGSTFNAKIKQLSGNNSPTYQTENSSIINIVRSNTLSITPTDNNIISTSDSNTPIYAWFNNGTLYYYTEALKPLLNNDSSYMFANLLKVTNIDLNTLDTSKTINMSYIFNKCISVEELDVSNFNTSNVENMEGMFAGGGASFDANYQDYSFDYRMSLKNIIGLTSFDTKKVTNMSRMFYSDNNLESVDVSSFDTSNVTTMKEMFSGNWNRGRMMMYLNEIKGIENFNTSNVTNMDGMFAMNQNLKHLDVSHFDTSNVTTFEFMFGACPSLGNVDVSNFNTSNAENMRWMFGYTNIDTLDLGNFDMSKVTNVESMLGQMMSIKNLKTPKVFPSNLSIPISATLYDPNTNIGYTSINSSTPTQTWLKMKYDITNLMVYGSFENAGWDPSSCQYDSTEKYVGQYSCKITQTSDRPEKTNWGEKVTLNSTHKYYVSIYAKSTIGTHIEIYWPIVSNGSIYFSDLTTTEWKRYSKVVDRTQFEDGDYNLRVDFNNEYRDGSIYYDGLILIDLTENFGVGNEPSKEWCDSNIDYFDGTISLYK